MKADIALVVLSCDKYSDLWQPFALMLEKNWPTCPFKKYLFSNEKPALLKDFTNVLSGPDKDWTSSFLNCLAQIPETYIILFFDDVFFSKPVQAEAEQKLISIIEVHQPDYFRFRPYPQPTDWIDKEIGYFKNNEAYRTALYAVWKKDVLMQILKPGESAWEFETQSVPRSTQFNKFMGTSYTFFNYIHGVEKGKWFRSAVQFLNKNNVYPDLNYRPQMSRKEDLLSGLRKIRGLAYIYAPPKLQNLLISLSRFIRNKIWPKW